MRDEGINQVEVVLLVYCRIVAGRCVALHPYNSPIVEFYD